MDIRGPLIIGLDLTISVVLVCGFVSGQDIKLPTIEKEVEVVPEPVKLFHNQVIDEIKQNELFVIESDTELFILVTPEDVISITTDSGPIRIRGIFAGGTGKNEIRSYNSNYIYIVEPLKSGNADIIMVPKGVSNKLDIIRHTLTISGLGPNPPPIPDVDPDVNPPDVDPTPVPIPTGIRVLQTFNENANRDQLNALNSLKLVQWVTNNCTKDADGRPEWRKWDRTSVDETGVPLETEVWQKIWEKVKPIQTDQNTIFIIKDTKIYYEKITNIDQVLSFLQRVKDGK